MRNNTYGTDTITRLATLCTLFCATFLVALCASSAFLAALSSSASSGGVGVAVGVAETIALSLKDSRDIGLSNSHLSIPIIPDADGSLGTADLIVDVATNNLTGYTLTMSGQTGETALIHATAAGNSIASTNALLGIPTVLAPNHWGYWRWEDGRTDTPTTFSRIPGSNTVDVLQATSTPAATSNTTLTFGANVDMATVQGSYRQTMVLTVLANYVPIPTPPEPDPSAPTTYGAMQNMTNAECSTTRGTAFDARNGQKYYVQKIGSLCWMETNLRYAGDGSWNSAWGYPDDRYATIALNTTASTNDDARPLSMTVTGNYFGGSKANASLVAGVVDAGGSTDFTNTATAGGFYGYLYNWCAAMGGQANACQESNNVQPDQNTSICPAGWHLPTGSSGADTDFKSLNTAANFGSTDTDQGLRFVFLGVYAGNYGMFYPAQGDSGATGYYWSSTITDEYSYMGTLLTHYATHVNPGLGYHRSIGSSVRCVMH